MMDRLCAPSATPPTVPRNSRTLPDVFGGFGLRIGIGEFEITMELAAQLHILRAAAGAADAGRQPQPTAKQKTGHEQTGRAREMSDW